jgi:hypothetical protein
MLVVVTLLVRLCFTPSEVLVTLTKKVQEELAARDALLRVTLPEPAVAVIVRRRKRR